jgi:aminopeptidase-like protein
MGPDMPEEAAPLDLDDSGSAMHRLVAELFPICRSITGDGLRQTLLILQRYVPLTIFEVPSGTKVFDWTVPKEWNIRDAYIVDGHGKRVVDFRNNNLHVLGYSIPVNKIVSLAELQEHLYSMEDQPEAIPYVTSYYKERWGFCISHSARQRLAEGTYRVVIDSDLKNGFLTYGELIIPGESEREVLLSTNICHPSLGNNELSGPVVTTFMAKWLAGQPRRYTYRILFIPETIGSLTYLSMHLDSMKRNTVAGFNVTCVGDEGTFSYLPSRDGATLADRAALNILRHEHPDYIHYSYLDRGSDERQYCSPGIDLPVVSIMRSKYREYAEYHTSLDDLGFVSSSGLQGSFAALRDCVELLERNRMYQATCLGEPQLGRRGLYPTLGTRDSSRQVDDLMNFLAFADGTSDLIDISDRLGVPVQRLYPIAGILMNAGLIVEATGGHPCK